MPDETARRELDDAIRSFGETWARGDTDALRGMLPVRWRWASSATRRLLYPNVKA